MVEQIKLFSNSLQTFHEPKTTQSNPIKFQKPIDSVKYEEEKKTGRWSIEEDELLKKIVPFYGEKQWRKISQHMKGRSAIQCLHRWTKILKPGLVKGPWTTEEDQRLYEWVAKEGPTKWSQCSQIIIGRSGKQCRERWFNNLNPMVKKGNWSIEEDDMIFKLYMQYGSSWSKIAKHLKGRTENSIKNRFYSTIRKIAADRKKLNQVKEEDNSFKLPITEEEEKKEILLEKPEKIIAEPTKELSLPSSIKEQDKYLPNFFQNSNTNNTLYKLLQEKGSEFLEPLTKESELNKLEKKGSKKDKNENPNIFENPLGLKDNLSECDSDSQFENLLMTIENTLNKELMLKEMNSYKDMTLDELQQKVFQFCNNGIIEFKEDVPDMHKDILEAGRKIGEDMKIKNFKPTNEFAKSVQTNMLAKSLDKPIPTSYNPMLEIKNPIPNPIEKVPPPLPNPGNNNISDDQKMYILIQQLHSLEGMLSNTREELMKLESSLNTNEKNNTLANLFQNKNEEIDFFSDNKHNNNFFNDFFLYENPMAPRLPNPSIHHPQENKTNVSGKRKSSFDLLHEVGSDLYKKQKIGSTITGVPDFDLNSLNFLNNILEDI